MKKLLSCPGVYLDSRSGLLRRHRDFHQFNAPASSSAVESPAAQFNAASYLSGDYPKLPEDGPAYSLSIGHAMQESTESHKMLLALKDAVEKV